MTGLQKALILWITLTLSISQAVAGVIGSTEIPLNGLRSDIRTLETNLGNLIADSYYWQAQESGLTPTIAFLNSGTVRNDSVIPVGDIDSTVPASVLPFNNGVVVIEDVTVSDLLLALENSVSLALEPSPSGYFLQVAGFLLSWSTSEAVGSRIIDVLLDDGTALIDNGVIVSGQLLNIATNSFLAGGGDGFSMFPGTYAITPTGSVDNGALTNFIQDGLSGRVSAADYPDGLETRIFRNQQIVFVPAPATLALIGLGLSGIGISRRKRVSQT